MTSQFPLQSGWGSTLEQERWREALEKVGTESVRLRLAQHAAGPGGSLAFGNLIGVAKGFAEEWLAWQEQCTREAEQRYRRSQARWTKAAAIASAVAAIAASAQAYLTYFAR